MNWTVRFILLISSLVQNLCLTQGVFQVKDEVENNRIHDIEVAADEATRVILMHFLYVEKCAPSLSKCAFVTSFFDLSLQARELKF